MVNQLKNMFWALIIGYFFFSSFLACANELVLEPQTIENQVSRADISDLIQAYSLQGDHRTGSKVDNKDAVWLENKLRRFGFQVSFEAVPFDRASAPDAKIIFKTLTKRILLGMPLLNSVGTGSSGLEGRFGEIDQLSHVPVYYYYEMLPSRQFSVQFLKRNHEGLEKLINQHAYPAIVVITQGNRVGLAPFNINLRHINQMPVILLSSSFGSLLERQVKINKQVYLLSKINRSRVMAKNVIAKLEGADPQLSPVIVMVSRSAWWNAAAGRGTSIAAWLVMAKKLAAIHPKRTVIFVALTGSEVGHLGYDQFVKDHQALLDKAHAWLYLGANLAANPASEFYLKTNNTSLDQLTNKILSANHMKSTLVDRPADFDLKTPMISFVGLSNGCFHLECDKWPHAVNIDAELKFITIFSQIVMALVK